MENNKSLYLNFIGYEIIKINVNKVEVESNNYDDIGFIFKMIPNDKKVFTKVNILQGVKIKSSEDFPYDIEIVIKGNFELSDSSTYDEKIQILITNANAILFPYLRATASLVSAQLENF